MALHIDRINSGSYREGPSGPVHEVEVLVTDVDGNEWTRKPNALRVPGMPAQGSAHPSVPELVLMERDVQSVDNSPSKFVVRLVYRKPTPGEVAPADGDYGPVTWTTDATTYSETTHKDIHGRDMRVQYQGYPVRDTINAITGEVIQTWRSLGVVNLFELGRVTVDRSTLVLRGARFERNDPERVASRFSPSVNKFAWRGYGGGEVLLRNVRSSPRADVGWNVDYEFHQRPQGWRAEITTEFYGAVPHDATEGNGIARYEIYQPRNFAELRL